MLCYAMHMSKASIYFKQNYIVAYISISLLTVINLTALQLLNSIEKDHCAEPFPNNHHHNLLL